MAIEMNKEQALFMINQLMDLVSTDDYITNDYSDGGIEILDAKSSIFFRAKNVGAPNSKMGTVRYFKIESGKAYLTIYTMALEGGKRGLQGYTTDTEFQYNYSIRVFSEVHKTFLKRFKPFIKRRGEIWAAAEEKIKAEEAGIFNDRIASMFPHVIDDILLGDKDDK